MSYPPQPPYSPGGPPPGWVPPPPPPPGYYPPPPLVIPPDQFNHGKHALITLFTCGAWLPGWFLMWVCHPRKAKVVQSKPPRR